MTRSRTLSSAPPMMMTVPSGMDRPRRIAGGRRPDLAAGTAPARSGTAACENAGR